MRSSRPPWALLSLFSDFVPSLRQKFVPVPLGGPRQGEIGAYSMRERGAVIDGVYRYCLWRRVGGSTSRVLFVMLNPSTADEVTDDPTIRRCAGFARRWGFGWLGRLQSLRIPRDRPTRVAPRRRPGGSSQRRHGRASRASCRSRRRSLGSRWSTVASCRCGHAISARLARVLRGHDSGWFSPSSALRRRRRASGSFSRAWALSPSRKSGFRVARAHFAWAGGVCGATLKVSQAGVWLLSVAG